jgi:hypothetical protein
MKTYQSFSKTNISGQLVNTEIKAKNIKAARKWFNANTIEHEKIYVKN